MPRIPSAALLFLSVTLMSRAAAAKVLVLEWSAPAGCPDRDEVLRRLAELGIDPDADEGPELRARGEVRALPSGEAQLVLETHHGARAGSRTLGLEGCDQAAKAAALVLSLAVRTVGASSTPPLEAESRLEWLGRFQGGLGVGPLPAPAASLGFAFGVKYGPARVELGLLRSPAVTVTLPGGPGLTAALDVPWMLELHACWEVWRGPVELEGCGGAESGQLHGRGMGVTDPIAATTPLVEWQAGIAIGRKIGPLWMRLEGSAVSPMTRPRFVFDGLGTVYAVPSLAGRGRFGVELRWP
jgi:hypothetical protein